MSKVKVIPTLITVDSNEQELEDWINDWIKTEYDENHREITITSIGQINYDTQRHPINVIIYEEKSIHHGQRLFDIVKFQSPIDKTIQRISKAYDLIGKLSNASVDHFTFIDDHQSRELDHIIISFSYDSIDPDNERTILNEINNL